MIGGRLSHCYLGKANAPRRERFGQLLSGPLDAICC